MVDKELYLWSLIAVTRQDYIERYCRAIEDYQQQYIPGGPEVMLELAIPEQQLVYKIYRFDLASGAVTPPNFTDVNVMPLSNIVQQTAQTSYGLSLELKQLVWNAVEFFTKEFDPYHSLFISWCAKWLDLQDTAIPGSNGLSGVIHSVTKPCFNKQAEWMFSVDFGSAPIEAFKELLATLHGMNIDAVKAGSSR